VDPVQALAELKQISVQVQDAVVFDGSGNIAASTLDEARGSAMAAAAARLLEQAEQTVERGEEIVQIEAVLPEGSVVVVREGARVVAATTAFDPTVGLIFYDLRTCLRSLAEADGQPKPKPRRKAPARKKAEDAA
jgi:predicted regulator of Ras-like GTPase activity (Roadblock/LC7/MglB family)